MPVAKTRNDPIIDGLPQPLQQLFVDNVTLRVDGQFHDHIAWRPAWQLRARNPGCREADGEPGLNLVTRRRAVETGTQD